jgi:hypothetical protein
MNAQINSILTRDLVIINNYKTGSIGLQKLLDSLEGSIDALEGKLPKEFLDTWDRHWEELDLIVALGKEKDLNDAIQKEIYELELSLISLAGGE